ncbi:MAG: hypothetical protein JXO51_00670 [Candidatus Aminicenantes bacterium]|nr:hypothetical protein [Candidatus Aminicenantes bacterium]
MDIKEKAREQLNWLERILHKIPGFKGYYGRELRRDSDRLQRDFIVKQLRRVKSGMNKVIQAAARRKDFDLLREYDLFVRTLDRDIGAMRYADQGYSGFFDLVKIREEELDRVYEQDALILEAMDLLDDAFKKLAAAPLDASGLEPLRAILDQVEALFEKRNAQLKGYEKGGEK